MTQKRYTILLIAGGSSRNFTHALHINKLIRVLSTLSQTVYLLSPYDKKLINLKENEVYTFPTSENRYVQFLKNQLSELKILVTIFSQQKIDIVFFSFGHDLAVLPILFSKLMGKKIILRSDGRPSSILKKYYKNQSELKQFFFRSIEYINYHTVDIITSECNFMLKANDQDQFHNCGVANLPVDMDVFHRTIPIEQREFDLGYFGMLDKGKGIINFLEAAAILIRNNKNISVFIIINPNTVISIICYDYW